MADDNYEPNRFMGFPVGTRRSTKNPQARQHARHYEESQRVMGFPVDWFGGVDRDWFRSLAHPVRGYRRWLRRRRLGPYAIDDDEP